MNETMSLWHDEMRLDYPPLDEEHVDFFKTVMRAAPAASSADFKTMDKVFLKCYDYARNHFAHEEDIMERIDFPDMVEHMKSHQMFIKHISDFRTAYEKAVSLEEKQRISIQTAEFLEVWFVGHLMSRDRLLKPYLVRLRNLPPRMEYHQ